MVRAAVPGDPAVPAPAMIHGDVVCVALTGTAVPPLTPCTAMTAVPGVPAVPPPATMPGVVPVKSCAPAVLIGTVAVQSVFAAAHRPVPAGVVPELKLTNAA